MLVRRLGVQGAGRWALGRGGARSAQAAGVAGVAGARGRRSRRRRGVAGALEQQVLGKARQARGRARQARGRRPAGRGRRAAWALGARAGQGCALGALGLFLARF